MRFPSVAVLVQRAQAVARRFPWTLATGAVAAAAAIIAVGDSANEAWVRRALVAALGLPATIGLTLLAETRRWSPAVRLLLPAGGLALLAAFYLVWPGVEIKHEAIRYFQLSAVLHLGVAFLPLLGAPESAAFWQYNRRLFLGFLRAGVFSGVLFVGVVVALAALNQLFGVKVEEETYARIWFVMALVVNTGIFLADLPGDIRALEHDTEYPGVLRVFAQYILTPLVFAYLLILLAYMVKLVAGAEWPSGWIGWLVSSVAVTGLLGFLLVHPLRKDPAEGWIRIYARWLFIGLIPAAILLLLAFWKRIEVYGLTEPRLLGLVLGAWLLAIALRFTLRPDTGIRPIPMLLAAVLLLTLYGPLSLTRISVASQRERLRRELARAAADSAAARQAGAALGFLLDHRAGPAIAQAVGRDIPPVPWDSIGQRGVRRDSVGTQIMALVGAPYIPDWQTAGRDQAFYFAADAETGVAIGGFEFLVQVSSDSGIERLAGPDTVRVRFDTTTGRTTIDIGADTVRFELAPVVTGAARAAIGPNRVPAAAFAAEPVSGSRRVRLHLLSASGSRSGDSLTIRHWTGSLLVGPRP